MKEAFTLGYEAISNLQHNIKSLLLKTFSFIVHLYLIEVSSILIECSRQHSVSWYSKSAKMTQARILSVIWEQDLIK